MNVLILLGAVLPVVVVVQGQLEGLPGGITDLNVPANHPLVQYAVARIQESQDNGDRLDLDSIASVRFQVTNRLLYYIRLRMTGNRLCKVTLTPALDRPIGRYEVVDRPECRDYDDIKRRDLAGGISDPAPLPSSGVDGQQKSVLDALDAAVCDVTQGNSFGRAYKIASTRRITYTSQVTAGMTYRYYNVPLVLTTCSSDVCHRALLANCDTHHSGKTKNCDFQVQYASWLPDSEKFTVEKQRLQACLDLD